MRCSGLGLQGGKGVAPVRSGIPGRRSPIKSKKTPSPRAWELTRSEGRSYQVEQHEDDVMMDKATKLRAAEQRAAAWQATNAETVKSRAWWATELEYAIQALEAIAEYDSPEGHIAKQAIARTRRLGSHKDDKSTKHVDTYEDDTRASDTARLQQYAIWLEERYAQVNRLEAENERLRAVVDAARAFVTWHQRGQPGTPDTLYPMTYGALDQWHAEWDRSLETLASALKDL